jgi:hypothetical protein
MFFKNSIISNEKVQASRLYTLLSNNSGQALLIIVLVMVVALTVGLAIATRTIINLRNTSDQAGSQKALAAAEAGIEQALKNNTAPGETINNSFTSTGTSNNTSFTTTVSAESGASKFLLNSGQEIAQNNATYIWVTPYDSNPANSFTQTWSGRITLYWGGDGTCLSSGIAALEVAVIYGPVGCSGAACKASPMLKRYALDPCSSSTRGGNYFTAVTNPDTSTFPGTNIAYSYQIDLSAVPVLLIRVNPVYASTVIGVSGAGGAALPDQGKLIISTGTSGKNITRKITVFEGYPEVPAEFFPYNLFEP